MNTGRPSVALRTATAIETQFQSFEMKPWAPAARAVDSEMRPESDMNTIRVEAEFSRIAWPDLDARLFADEQVDQGDVRLVTERELARASAVRCADAASDPRLPAQQSPEPGADEFVRVDNEDSPVRKSARLDGDSGCGRCCYCHVPSLSPTN